MSEFRSITCPRAQQTALNTPFSIASGQGQRQKWAWLKIRAHFARVLFIRTPLGKILDPPLLPIVFKLIVNAGTAQDHKAKCNIVEINLGVQ